MSLNLTLFWAILQIKWAFFLEGNKSVGPLHWLFKSPPSSHSTLYLRQIIQFDTHTTDPIVSPFPRWIPLKTKMPLFISDEEMSHLSNDAASVAARADAYIRDLQTELETVKARSDAAAITAEQTCSLLEQKFISLQEDFSKLESQNAHLQKSLEERVSELAQVQSQKHQLHLQSVIDIRFYNR